ncbi:hypothetical protein GPECTOR_9g684 [Gonium pectorale]|uniref:Uncharacterized protein n=1 Tax=Gonium pectorale TaxID=33097 RepID=A0A150GRZ4_GONPE|nr:hypothetical protein GPECTOR_9g684 [Gonium pectorale]|eukprot:KXZ52639.1 hypothetical protein GPECTOR_9g684 [Gonium pectorale]
MNRLFTRLDNIHAEQIAIKEAVTLQNVQITAVAQRVDSMEPRTGIDGVVQRMDALEGNCKTFLRQAAAEAAGQPDMRPGVGLDSRRVLSGSNKYMDVNSLVAFEVANLPDAPTARDAICNIIGTSSEGRDLPSFSGVRVLRQSRRKFASATTPPAAADGEPLFTVRVGVNSTTRRMLFAAAKPLAAAGIVFRDDLSPFGAALKSMRNDQFRRLQAEGRQPRWLGPLIEYRGGDGRYYMVEQYDVAESDPKVQERAARRAPPRGGPPRGGGNAATGSAAASGTSLVA